MFAGDVHMSAKIAIHIISYAALAVNVNMNRFLPVKEGFIVENP